MYEMIDSLSQTSIEQAIAFLIACVVVNLLLPTAK